MNDWKRISHLDFCLLLEDNSVFVTTCEKRLPSAAKLDDFRQSTALCLANTTCCLYKITEKSDVPYLLVVWGSDASVSTIGELAVCQIQSILEGFSEKNDKNSFMQKLLLGNYTEVEAFNRARKLHISTTARRAVFLVTTRQSQDEHALATIKPADLKEMIEQDEGAEIVCQFCGKKYQFDKQDLEVILKQATSSDQA